jgi:hypothetical protein
MKFLFFISFIVYSVHCQDGWLKDATRAVSGTACLLSVSPKLTSDCLKDFNEELESRPEDEKNSKAVCCAYLQLQSCVLKISEKECGQDGESVAKGFLKTINRGITSDDCIDYGFISCITVTQVVIFAAVVLALMALLSCICCCCCRR